jgi:hypothetical protein
MLRSRILCRCDHVVQETLHSELGTADFRYRLIEFLVKLGHALDCGPQDLYCMS